MIHERTFPATRASVAWARHFTLGVVPDLDDDTRGEIAIMVSELATNAVLHAQTDFRVSVEMSADGRVRVAVTDSNDGDARLQPPAVATQPNGRGLRIVSEFSDRWGVTPHERAGGKTVWFTVKAPSRVG